MNEAFSEGYADYFAVVSKLSQTADTLHIAGLEPTLAKNQPNSIYSGRNLADSVGYGEDNELSVAEFLYALDRVGVNVSGEFPDVTTIKPFLSAELFDQLSSSHATDLAEFCAVPGGGSGEPSGCLR